MIIYVNIEQEIKMNFSKSKISIPTASTISKLVTNTNSKEKLKKVELATLENIAHELVKKNKEFP